VLLLPSSLAPRNGFSGFMFLVAGKMLRKLETRNAKHSPSWLRMDYDPVRACFVDVDAARDLQDE